MTKRAVVLYWVLILVPALVVGAAGTVLICREQARVNERALSTARIDAERLAADVGVAVADIQDDLTKRLLALQPMNVKDVLDGWKRADPVIRQSFVWHPRFGLQVPRLTRQSDPEDRLFAARYDALFSARVPFERAQEMVPVPPPVTANWPSLNTISISQNSANANAQDNDAAGPGAAVPEAATQQQDVGEPRQAAIVRQRADLRGIGRAQRNDASPELWLNPRVSGATRTSSQASGWIPWFSENQLYLLGWARTGTNGFVYGVEIEMMWLLSRLVAAWPAEAPQGQVYALLDGSGNVFHQSGPVPIESGMRPAHVVELGRNLPHWQVAVYVTSAGATSTGSRRLVMLWGLLLVIFLAAIAVGGALLTREAHRGQLDARQKTSFVSNVSHELKTPLTSIRMYAELMKEGRVSDPRKLADYLGVIVSESQRLTRLVNNVLDFSRLEQGRKKYRMEQLDLGACLHDLLETQRLRIQEAGVTQSLELPPGPTIATTDRDALEQTVLNLVDNAVKYAASGEELTVRVEALDRGWRVLVMDRGSGVQPAHRDRIFDKFHRADDSLTAALPGSGLGLSIARGLMRGMGGDVTYEPRDGGGSCFVVRLG